VQASRRNVRFPPLPAISGVMAAIDPLRTLAKCQMISLLPVGEEQFTVRRDVLLELAVEPTSAVRELTEGTVQYIAASMGLDLHIEQETGQFLLGGCSEKALNGALAMLRNIVGDGVRSGAVQSAYRESVKGPADADYSHKTQSGGAGEFARVIVRVAPSASLWGVQFRNDDANGNVPSEFVDAVEKGARDAAEMGVLMGMPLIATEIRLIDGAYHDVDSSPAAFEQAARCAVIEALRRAKVRLMEPLATVAVLTPEQHVTAIADELRRRNASPREVQMGSTSTIAASSRMFDLLGFEAALNSISGDEARTTFILSGFAEVPSDRSPLDTMPAAAALRA